MKIVIAIVIPRFKCRIDKYLIRTGTKFYTLLLSNIIIKFHSVLEVQSESESQSDRS